MFNTTTFTVRPLSSFAARHFFSLPLILFLLSPLLSSFLSFLFSSQLLVICSALIGDWSSHSYKHILLSSSSLLSTKCKDQFDTMSSVSFFLLSPIPADALVLPFATSIFFPFCIVVMVPLPLRLSFKLRRRRSIRSVLLLLFFSLHFSLISIEHAKNSQEKKISQ